jgi:hypothetical protein
MNQKIDFNHFEYAGLIRRLIAWLIDATLLMPISKIYYYLLSEPRPMKLTVIYYIVFSASFFYITPYSILNMAELRGNS